MTILDLLLLAAGIVVGAIIGRLSAAPAKPRHPDPSELTEDGNSIL